MASNFRPNQMRIRHQLHLLLRKIQKVLNRLLVPILVEPLLLLKNLVVIVPKVVTKCLYDLSLLISIIRGDEAYFRKKEFSEEFGLALNVLWRHFCVICQFFVDVDRFLGHEHF